MRAGNLGKTATKEEFCPIPLEYGCKRSEAKDTLKLEVKKEAVVTRGRKKTMSMAGHRVVADVGELGGQLGWEGVASGTQVDDSDQLSFIRQKIQRKENRTQVHGQMSP